MPAAPDPPDTDGAPPAISGRHQAPPFALRLRNRLRTAVDASYRYELAWLTGGTLALTLLLAAPPWGLHYGELVVGQPAPRDLIVPLDVEIPDEAGTMAMREIARRGVASCWVLDTTAADRAEHAIAEAFDAGRRTAQASGRDASDAPDEAVRQAVLLPLPTGTPADVVRVFYSSRFSPALEDDLKAALRALLSRRIVPRRDLLPSGEPISVRPTGGGPEELLSDFSTVDELDAARRQARQAATGLPGLPPLSDAGRRAIAGLAERLIAPTLTLDQQETLRRMDESAARVPTRFARIERGTVLARRGTPLTAEVVEQARAIERARPQRLEPLPLLGTAALSALLFGFLRLYPRVQRLRGGPEHLFPMLVLLVLIMIVIARVFFGVSSLLVDRFDPPFNRLETVLYAFPAAAGGMLAALLFSGRVAMVYTVFFSVPYAVLAGWDLRLLAFTLVTHFAAIFAARHYRTRSAVLKGGFVVGLVGAFAAVAIDLSSGSATGARVVASDALVAAVGGAVGVSLLASFLLPFCESLFGVLTDVRLLELSNLNNPLLSQLAASAPGSYNHSLIVGALAESAAEAIGANGLFCRVAAFYHDVGKMKMPEYYIENQRGGANPHERLQPNMSSLVLASHVKEGARLAREHGLPQQIVDVIPQHHGTRVMTYFYEKARTAAEASGSSVSPDDFRYPGPKPQTREAAIFMLSDSVEAAARTIERPTPETFRAMIRQIAGRVALDGQFDECDLTFRDLDTICESFVRSLVSIYHHRVDYPTYVFEAARANQPARG